MKAIMKIVLSLLPLLAGVLLVGCEQVSDEKPVPSDKVGLDARYVRSQVDPARLIRGRDLFRKNCTVCHGLNAEGDTDWKKRDKDGKYPAPPLNGTGHAWHHPGKALMHTIKSGTKAIGGTMPAWKDRFTDEEIESIILWLQSSWPDELYQAWARRDKESNKAR